MAARTPEHVQPHRHERKGRLGRRVVGGIGAAALGLVAFVGIDSAVTNALEPDIAPGVTRISGEEECRRSKAVYFTMSSMGLPIAQYTGGNVRELVEKHGGCVMATSYGTSYNERTQAVLTDSMLQAVREVTPPGRSKEIFIHAQSFGIYPARAALMSDQFKAAEAAGKVSKGAFIIESSPSGKESVKNPIGLAMIELSERGVRIGKGTLAVINIGGALGRQDDMLSKRTWEDIGINTMATSTKLMGDQMERIGTGLTAGEIGMPMYYLGSDLDAVVKIDTAIEQIQAVENTTVKLYAIKPLPGSYNHGGAWLHTEYRAAGYEDALQDVLDTELPMPPRPQGGPMASRPA